MAKGDASHIDQLERYIAENISLVDLQDEADLKRRILDLYERDNKAGKNAKGIRNYARNDWQKTPSASNWYQATLDEVEAGRKNLVDAIGRINTIEGLREFESSNDVEKFPENVKNVYRAAQEKVYNRAISQVHDYEELRNFNQRYKPADFPSNVKEIYTAKQREIKAEADKIYDEKINIIGEYAERDPNKAGWKDDREFKTDRRLDLSELKSQLSREQYAKLSSVYNDKEDQLRDIRESIPAPTIEKIEGERPYKIVGRRFRKERYHLAT